MKASPFGLVEGLASSEFSSAFPLKASETYLCPARYALAATICAAWLVVVITTSPLPLNLRGFHEFLQRKPDKPRVEIKFARSPKSNIDWKLCPISVGLNWLTASQKWGGLERTQLNPKLELKR